MSNVHESGRNKRKVAALGKILVKEEERSRYNQVVKVLQIPDELRTCDQRDLLTFSPEVVRRLAANKRKKEARLAKVNEIEDEPDKLHEKCMELAKILRQAKHAVVFTGAGISTAASIPDYRGPNGIWTLQGKGIEPGPADLSQATPTYTHLALSTLMRHNIIKHVVSQNCDGLHLRSGMDRNRLSEIHGNMYLEVCSKCPAGPTSEYVRTCDVTQKTGVRRHTTGRNCHRCSTELKDTIVHFGEKGGMGSPYNWEEARTAVDKSDLILCLGSSLKVLKKYACLWSMDKPVKKRSALYIVNLQWTPKDDISKLKINGRCDEVMRQVMDRLELTVSNYQMHLDPLFDTAIPFTPEELAVIKTTVLAKPNCWDHACTSPTDVDISMHMSLYTRCDSTTTCCHTLGTKDEKSANTTKAETQSQHSATQINDRKQSPGWYGLGNRKGQMKRKSKRKIIKRP